MTVKDVRAVCGRVAVVSGGVGALWPASAGAAAARLGVSVHPWRFEASERPPFWALRDPAVRDRSFAALQAAGVSRARVDLRWNVIEQHFKGVRDWSEFDAIHRSAVAHGIKLLPSVAFTPAWASGVHDDEWAPPRNAADYGDFMAAALERYPDVDAWEIWNEPNLAFFWRPKPDVRGFVALLRAADEARRRVGSDARLISGGLSSTGEEPFAWFDEMARLGAFAHVDGFAFHPYGRTRPPDDRKGFFLKVPEFRERLVKLGRSDIEIWLTEYGTPNTDVETQYGPPISAEQQAENLGRAVTLASLWPWVENLTWYELQEGCTDAAHHDCRFGLFDHDFNPKPAFERLAAVAAGQRTRVRSEVTVAAGTVRARRSVRVRGALVKAGEAGANGPVRVRAVSGRRVRTVTAAARGGSYAAKLGRLRRGTWRVTASFAGTALHLPAKSPAARLRVR